MIVGFLALTINTHGFSSLVEAAQKVILRGVSTTNAEGLTLYRHYDYLARESVKELISDSDAIIKGEVINVHSPEVMITGFINSDGSNEPLKDVYTVSEIRVNKVLKGKFKSGDVIKVRQIGGIYKGSEYPTDHPEIFTKNINGVFFLKLIDNAPAELLNPYQGIVKIVDGKVNNKLDSKSFKKHFISPNGSQDSDLTFFKNGTTEEDLMKLIEESN